MFKAYVDESGIHADADMFVLAGYLAPAKEWERFSRKWQAVLDRYGITVFHASECNGNKGEFSKFEGNREERNQFVGELLATISQRPRILPINLGVVVSEFPSLEHRRVQARAGHPYYVCMKALMAVITLVMRRFPDHERVALVFDRQDQFDARAREVFDQMSDEDWEGRERFLSIDFQSRQHVIPLQAADELAYESYMEFRRRREHSEKIPRPSYGVLTTNKVLSPEWVLDLAEAHSFIRDALNRKD